MKTDSPFPPWDEMSCWLAGQGAAVLLVAIVSLVWVGRSRAAVRGRRLGALGWGFACTAMPVAWLVARWLPQWAGGWVDGQQPREFGGALAVAATLHGLAVMLAVYLSDLGDQTTPERGSPPARAATGFPEAGRGAEAAKEAAATTANLPAGTKPTLAPPQGDTMAARARPALQADGLIRVLSEGSSMQRAAAAKALALSFGDTAHKLVVHGLLDLMADPDSDDESRVEAWIATCKVMGDPLSWTLEAALRRDGPESIDPAQILVWQDRLAEPD